MPLTEAMRFCVLEDDDLWWQCVTHCMLWHNIDQLCTKYNTVSMCGAVVVVVPVHRAALALKTTAPGTGLSLMICLLLTLPNHIAVSLPQSLNCSHRKQSG